MKFDIENYRGKYVMHCKTEEEAKEFFNYMELICEPLTYSLHCCYGDNVSFFNSGTWCTKEYARRNGYTILEWSDFMNKEFTKANLKTGDVVKLRNEELGIVLADFEIIILQNGGQLHYETISEDLTDAYNVKEYDIVAVKRPIDKYDCAFSSFERNNGIFVYERKEVEEMTLAEVCKLLGKEIKIVK
jgi:hypothetical protein